MWMQYLLLRNCGRMLYTWCRPLWTASSIFVPSIDVSEFVPLFLSAHYPVHISLEWRLPLQYLCLHCICIFTSVSICSLPVIDIFGVQTALLYIYLQFICICICIYICSLPVADLFGLQTADSSRNFSQSGFADINFSYTHTLSS